MEPNLSPASDDQAQALVHARAQVAIARIEATIEQLQAEGESEQVLDILRETRDRLAGGRKRPMSKLGARSRALFDRKH